MLPFRMAKSFSDGTLVYERHIYRHMEPGSAVWHYAKDFYIQQYTACGMVEQIKVNVRNRMTRRRRVVKDYLLADVAIELGFDVGDVLEVMSGKPYAY